MQRNIVRSYLHITSKDYPIKSRCEEKNLEVFLEEKPTPDLCKFFYKEIGKDFFWRDRLKWSDQDWLNYINNDFFKLYILKYNNKLA